jgi:hypothetical protein
MKPIHKTKMVMWQLLLLTAAACAARESLLTVRVASGESFCLYEDVIEAGSLSMEFQVHQRFHCVLTLEGSLS